MAQLYDVNLSSDDKQPKVRSTTERKCRHFTLGYPCHLQHPQGAILRSRLGTGWTNDGNLEVHEILGMELPGINLVVLSACNTALGKHSNGDELVGLTRVRSSTPAATGLL